MQDFASFQMLGILKATIDIVIPYFVATTVVTF